MDVMVTHGAGWDVPKKTVMAYRVTPEPTGEHADGIMELKALGAMTVDLRASFSSPVAQRDGRDLPRDRTTLVQEHSRAVNRVQGVLERATIKLAAVATDIMGGVGPCHLGRVG